MKAHKNLTISVVIPALNEAHYLAKCLETIQQYKTPAVKEIIIIDNGSTDDTVKVAKRYPGVKVLRYDHPLGLPRAREPGFLAAKGDLIASLDADTMIPDNWFSVIESTFKKDASLSCMSGPYHYYDFPALQYIAHRIMNAAISIPWLMHRRVIGGNFVIRRQVISKVNLFDTERQFWGEDTTMGQKIRSVGRILYTEKLFVYASARRWKKEGFAKMGWKYLSNYFCEELFNRTAADSKEAVAVR